MQAGVGSNQAARCLWRGKPQWRQLAMAYWNDAEQCTPAKLKRYKRAMSGLSPASVLVCTASAEDHVAVAVFVALLAKRMVGAEVHLVATHHSLLRQLQAQLEQLACPAEYDAITAMLPLHLLPLEYLYWSLEFPRATQLHVCCDEVVWAAVRIIRPHARRWSSTMPLSSCLEVCPEQGHWRWLRHDASALG